MAIYSVILLMTLWAVAPVVAELSSPPENVSIKSCKRNSVVLTWDAPRGGADGLFYWVFLNLTSDPDDWINYRNISGDSQERELAVPPWGTYSFRLKASTYYPYGYITEISDPTPQNCTIAPDRPYENPTDVDTVTDTENKLIIVWRPMSRLFHNGPDFRYVVTWWKYGEEERHQVLVNNPYANRSEAFVPDTYAFYGITVQAANALGLSAKPPRPRYAHSGEGKPLFTPTDLQLFFNPNNPHVIRLEWTAVDLVRDQMNGQFKGYRFPPHAQRAVHRSPPMYVTIESCIGRHVQLIWEFHYKNSIDHVLIQFNTSDNVTQWHFYDSNIPGDAHSANIVMPPWGTYAFRVIAHNVVGYGEPSWHTYENCSTPPEIPIVNPTNVHTLTNKPGRLIIAWTPMPRLLHYGPGLKYVITYLKNDSSSWDRRALQVDNPYQDTVEVDTYGPYELYEISIRSRNAVGQSVAPPTIIYGYSGEEQPRVQPDRFRLDPDNAMESHKAHFIWDAVDSSRTMIQGEFKGYKIRYWKASEDKEEGTEVDILITEEDRSLQIVRATIDDLPASTAFRAQVSVINTYHTGPPSQILDFSTSNAEEKPISISLTGDSAKSSAGGLEEKTNPSLHTGTKLGASAITEEQAKAGSGNEETAKPSVVTRENVNTNAGTAHKAIAGSGKEKTAEASFGTRQETKRMHPAEQLPKSKILEQLLEELLDKA